MFFARHMTGNSSVPLAAASATDYSTAVGAPKTASGSDSSAKQGGGGGNSTWLGRLAPRDVAYAFCLEVPCRDIIDRGSEAGQASEDLGRRHQPFAIHAAWYYNTEGDIRRLLDASMSNLLDVTASRLAPT